MKKTYMIIKVVFERCLYVWEYGDYDN